MPFLAVFYSFSEMKKKKRREEVLGVSISGAVIRLFEILKMFYPPEGLCGAEPERGPIVFTLHFIGVRRSIGGFKICIGNPPF